MSGQKSSFLYSAPVWYSKRKKKSSVGQAVLYNLPHIFKRGKVVEKAIGVKQSNYIIVQLYIRTVFIGP